MGDYLPDFSQGFDPTCELASIVSAVIIRDWLSGSVSTSFAALCKLTAAYYKKNKAKVIKVAKIPPENQQKLDDFLFILEEDTIAKKNNLITNLDYQTLSGLLYYLNLTEQPDLIKKYLLPDRLGKVFEILGFPVILQFIQVTQWRQFFMLDAVKSLRPGQMVQVIWAVMVPHYTNTPGNLVRSPHAFLMGSARSNDWFLYDQAPALPKKIHGTSLVELATNIDKEIGKGYKLFGGTAENNDARYSGIRILKLT